jgi:hypothetical protein
MFAQRWFADSPGATGRGSPRAKLSEPDGRGAAERGRAASRKRITGAPGARVSRLCSHGGCVVRSDQRSADYHFARNPVADASVVLRVSAATTRLAVAEPVSE